jgi:hypothetical protein
MKCSSTGTLVVRQVRDEHVRIARKSGDAKGVGIHHRQRPRRRRATRPWRQTLGEAMIDLDRGDRRAPSRGSRA